MTLSEEKRKASDLKLSMRRLVERKRNECAKTGFQNELSMRKKKRQRRGKRGKRKRRKRRGCFFVTKNNQQISNVPISGRILQKIEVTIAARLVARRYL